MLILGKGFSRLSMYWRKSVRAYPWRMARYRLLAEQDIGCDAHSPLVSRTTSAYAIGHSPCDPASGPFPVAVPIGGSSVCPCARWRSHSKSTQHPKRL